MVVVAGARDTIECTIEHYSIINNWKLYFHAFTDIADDQEGYSAEYYADHEQSESILSHKQLLRDYGADESLADDMLIDQGKPCI